jgi:hypothetical protein
MVIPVAEDEMIMAVKISMQLSNIGYEVTAIFRCKAFSKQIIKR